MTLTKEILYNRQMLGVRKINPTKIKEARGDRTRSQIVKNAGGRFTEQDLYNWEKGVNLPRPENQVYLVAGLGVTFEQITDEVSFQIGV